MTLKTVPLLLILFSVAIPLAVSVHLNQGHLIYTLDDPYIHLALARNIHQGHYGINPGESTAPSSSILWPFLLAPFAQTGVFILLPLFLNLIFAAVTGFLLFRFFRETNLIIFIVSVFAFNLAGLVLTGMEHSLQVLLTVVIAAGAAEFSTNGRCSGQLLAALVIAPLVRYECLAVSVPVLLFLFFTGEKKRSLTAAVILFVCLAGFSLFLLSIGLEPLPASVFAKSSVVSGAGTVHSLLANLKASLESIRGIVQAAFVFPLVLYGLGRNHSRRQRLLAWASAFAVVLHLLAGRFGWFHRYGVYIWVYSVMICFHLYRDSLEKYRMIAAVILAAAGFSYLSGYLRIPHASSNIYRQQYQMSRFVDGWLREPVALNDLGLVALGSEYYVLDLWGLATPEALDGSSDPLWVDSAAASHGINCAIVYMEELPGIQHWRRVARLELHPPLVVCASGGVDFLSAPWADADSLLLKIESFAETLPDGIDLI